MLSASGLTVQYGAGALAIADVNIEIGSGQVVAILGPNGAGKTTTLRALSGFMRTETAKIVQGQVTYGGHDVTRREPHHMAGLGVVAIPERNKVFSNLTVGENLRALQQRDTGATNQFPLPFVLNMFPFLSSRLNDVAGLLSGGQQQMLAIARGLLLNPTILMIDEMTLGLHPSIHSQLFEAVQEITRTGTAVLLVDEGTTSALEIADVVHVLSGGRVRASGPREMFGDRTFLEELYLAG